MKRNWSSPLLHYFKSNICRFGSAIQVLPSDIREYFKLGFIFVVVVFIFDRFFSFVFRNHLCKVYYLCYSKNVFFNHCRILFVRNKVYLPTYLITHSLTYLVIYLLTSLLTYLLTSKMLFLHFSIIFSTTDVSDFLLCFVLNTVNYIGCSKDANQFSSFQVHRILRRLMTRHCALKMSVLHQNHPSQ